MIDHFFSRYQPIPHHMSRFRSQTLQQWTAVDSYFYISIQLRAFVTLYKSG